jgi:hypothetical protein
MSALAFLRHTRPLAAEMLTRPEQQVKKEVI